MKWVNDDDALPGFAFDITSSAKCRYILVYDIFRLILANL